MASVTSLDKDLRKMRLDKYTPAAAKEAQTWIEETLGERLPAPDLLEGLKDGQALCKLINLAIGPPGIKFKKSAMPFVQMENISHFLRACQSPPLNLQDHDVFLTVDLYEQKDPAQVLQCLGAFSRAATSVNPSAFPTPIGPKGRGSLLSPQSTGPASPLRARGISNASNASSGYGSRPTMVPSRTGGDSPTGRWSPTKGPMKSPTNGRSSPGQVSSWSRREHEGATSPAWNIAQYGYMGGASQGNLGISFGGRRQITSAGPLVPNLADKERRRKEREAEEGRQRQQMEEEERQRQAEIEAEEERARLEEERRWEEETQRLREEERRKVEEEKLKWEEEERQWQLTEEKRRKEEEEAEARVAEERQRARSKSDARLRGQFLSQYKAEQNPAPDDAASGFTSRIQQLEKELEQARQREQEYERERQERSHKREEPKARHRSRSRLAQTPSRTESWSRHDREVLHTPHSQWNPSQAQEQPGVPRPSRSPRPLPVPTAAPPAKLKTHTTGGSRPLPDPTAAAPPAKIKPQNTGGRALPDPTAAPAKIKSQNTGGRALPDPTAVPAKIKSQNTGGRALPDPTTAPAKVQSHNTGGRALPDPATYTSPPSNRTDRFLASNPAPAQAAGQPTYSRELGATAERDAEDRRRAQSQAKTKAGGFASKSLLEREMEMERQRQREWEEAQQETAKAVRNAEGVDGIGGGIGGRWDVSQWSGFASGDSQNRGGQGIGAGRRQIVGPRPLPNTPGGPR